MSKHRALGKGLSALISESKIDFIVNKENAKKDELDITHLQVGKYQPRTIFDEESIRELSASIKEHGIISPIVVRPVKGQEDRYEIIAGERRWRASKLAQLKKVPVIIRELDDKTALEFAIVENIQRQDLTPLEEAESYQRLMQEFSYTQEELKNVIGKSRSHIANLLRLLTLPDSVKEKISNGEISFGHAKTLVASNDPEQLANDIIEQKLTVRQTEKIIKDSKPKKEKPIKDSPKLNINIRDFDEDYSIREVSQKPKNSNEDLAIIEESLTKSIGMKVSIDDSSSKVIIHFDNINQLESIIQKFNQSI